MGQTDLGEEGSKQGFIPLRHRHWLEGHPHRPFLLDEGQTGTKVPSSPKTDLLFPFSITGAFPGKNIAVPT